MKNPFENKELASAAGKKGSQRAAAVKRKKRELRDCAKLVLSLCPEVNPSTKDALKRMGVDVKEELLTVEMISILSIAQQAMKGDSGALDKIIEYSGGTSNEKQRLDRERLAFDRQRYADERNATTDAANANEQIEALADLINHPTENVDIESLGSGEE